MEKYDYSENILCEFNPVNLANLYERSIQELEDFVDLFNMEEIIDDALFEGDSTHKMYVVFQEVCFLNRISDKQV